VAAGLGEEAVKQGLGLALRLAGARDLAGLAGDGSFVPAMACHELRTMRRVSVDQMRCLV
jgi:hypothetical protein